MPKTTVHSAESLAHYLLNANAAGIGDATGLRGSSTAGSVYISLYTSSPGVGGDQSTNEANFTGYARVAVARSAAGWEDISGTDTVLANVAEIAFPANAGSTQVVTHVGVGDASSGAGKLRYFDALNEPFSIDNGVPFTFPIHQLALGEE